MSTSCVLLLGLGYLAIYSVAQLTQDEERMLLLTHNDARTAVIPPAANMLQMEWDSAIARNAQTYANRCNFEHSRRSERILGVNFTSVGENLFVTSSTEFSGERLITAVTSWVNEKADYTYSTGACSAICGHYTQVVWANSVKLGCGSRSCSTISNAGRISSGTLVVCQYGPTGNFIGQPPYVSGASCSQCPSERPLCSNGLCGLQSNSVSLCYNGVLVLIFLLLANLLLWL